MTAGPTDPGETPAGETRRRRLITAARNRWQTWRREADWRRLAVVGGLLVAFVIVSALVIPRLQADGDVKLTQYDFLNGKSIPGLRTGGSVQRQPYGYLVPPAATGRVSLPVSTSAPPEGIRTELIVTGGGLAGSTTHLSLRDPDGTVHDLGTPMHWVEHHVDVTDLLAGGGVQRLRFVTTNGTQVSQLMVLQVRVATYPADAVPRVGRWEVSLWGAFAVLMALALLRRVRAEALLVLAAWATVFVVWPDVQYGAFHDLPSDLWGPAINAEWIDLDTGLLSGTFGIRSSLAVQLFHALTPITGTGVVGARTASVLVGVLAIAAIYALGRRVAGRLGAGVAVACALLTEAFRTTLSTGSSAAVLVLAACLFALAVHRVLVRPDRGSMITLGVAGAVAILAEPTWWPGIIIAVVILAWRYSPRGTLRSALVAALAALVLVSLPARLSVAHQSGGDVNGDVIARATAARNVEFVGRGHGAPATRNDVIANPTSGPKIGLFGYVFGEHSLSVVGGEVLNGAYEGISATSDRTEARLLSRVAFIAMLVGIVFLLLVPSLRMLALIPALVAIVPWFFGGRDVANDFPSLAPFWPAMLVGAAAVAYALRGLVQERIGAPRAGAALRRRVERLRRSDRRAEPAKP